MVAKRSSRALAVLLALPSAAFAVGLGDIHLLSPLNAPLDAEIDLVDVAPDEMNTLQVQLASRDTFAQNGLDYPSYLSGVKVKTVRTPDGREVIKLKSNDVISDPFLTLLVEVNWARGRLVREYTVLLDPPVYAPGPSQVASAPIAAPTTGAGTREGTIARSEPPPAAAPAEPAATMPATTAPDASAGTASAPASEPAAASAAAPAEAAPAAAATAAVASTAAASTAAADLASAAPAPTAPAPSAPTAPAPSAPTAPAPSAPTAPAPTAAMAEPAPSATESTATEAASTPSAEPAAATAGEGEASTHLVHRGETLSQIAASAAGAKATSAHAHSWMLAIYQANPRAFEKNMNLLRSGAVLRMPDAAAIAAVSPAEASAEIRRQYAEWHGATASRGEAAAPAPSEATAAAQPARLKLVTPTESPSVGAAPGAKSGEVAALQGRVHDLEGQLAESKRLLELKDADLARLQSELASKQAPAPAPAPAAAPPPPAAAPSAPAPITASAPAPAEQPPVAQNTPAPAPAPAVEEKPQPAVQTPPVAAKPPAARETHKPAPAASSGGFLDKLLGYWWVLLLALLGAGAVFGLRLLKARRAAQFDDSLDRLAEAGTDDSGPDFGNLESTGSFRGFGASEPPLPAARAKPAPRPEASFLVEETGSHERPRQAAGATPPAPTPRHVASDETISSETAINLDQGDPLAEADFHMAYGLYDQAADLIRIAISREPTRRDLKLKLLEVFFVWGNKDQFLQTARELAETRADAAPGEWEKILIMGKQLAPEDPLFSGPGAVTGAAAGGVDLDLEGGQSRVDFDLLGEPSTAGNAHGVDLDIGTAVGEGLGAESATGATDRNVALLENSFVGGGTGTTRQMTARMRQNGTATAEIEGPTVEQPALTARDNPTIRAKLETAMRKGAGAEQTAELAIDDLGLDVGSVDTVDQPGIAAAASSTPDAPTLVAGLDERSRRVMEDAHQHAKEETGNTTGAWQFDQNELEAALTQTSLAVPDVSATSRLAALRGIDVDVGDITGTHASTATDVDVDVGTATGTHATNGRGLDLDVGTATVPDAAFAATQRLTSDELALPDLEPVTMSEVGTKLDLARAYMDMGDPDGARNILEEVLHEGSAAQKQEAQRLMESLP